MPGSRAIKEAEPFRGIVANLPAALYTTDAEGRITYFNDAAAAFWGRRPALGVDMWCGSWRLYTSDGAFLPHDQCPMAVAIKTGKPVRGVEAMAERPDGVRVSFTPFPTPLFDADGRMTGAVNVLIELHGRAAPKRTLRIVPANDPGKTAVKPARANLAQAIAALFDQASRMLHPGDARISAEQWAVLRYLALSRRGRSKDEIAAYFGEQAPHVVRQLSALVRRRLVVRIAILRGVNETLKLTDQGREALANDPVQRLAGAIARIDAPTQAKLAAGLEAVAAELRRDSNDAR